MSEAQKQLPRQRVVGSATRSQQTLRRINNKIGALRSSLLLLRRTLAASFIQHGSSQWMDRADALRWQREYRRHNADEINGR